MNDWQVQAMWEADAAMKWEQMNQPDPLETNMVDAARSMDKAMDLFRKVIDLMYDAEVILKDSPMADRVGSYVGDMEEMRDQIRYLTGLFKRGKRG